MPIKQSLFRQTKLNGTLDDIWHFFSTPLNLARITPPDMRFEIRSDALPADIHEGLIIEYRVRPAFHIPTKWVSRIDSVDPGSFFVDSQVHGPYKRWEHTHIFEAQDDGVLMTDHVLYQLPGGQIGSVADSWVSARLKHIFDFREKVIKEIFN